MVIGVPAAHINMRHRNITLWCWKASEVPVGVNTNIGTVDVASKRTDLLVKQDGLL